MGVCACVRRPFWGQNSGMLGSQLEFETLQIRISLFPVPLGNSRNLGPYGLSGKNQETFRDVL